MSTVAARRTLGERRRAWRSPRALGWGAAVLAALLLVWQADVAGAGSAPDALPETVRAGLAAVVLFGLCGYAPARLLLPRSMRAHLWLFVLPVGAVVAAIALTLLGFLHVPLAVSLAAVLLTGAAGGAWLRLTRGPLQVEAADRERAGGRGWRLWWPLYIGLLVGALALLPMFRAGVATVIGENPDAMLAAGSAELLQQEPPRTIEPSLPVDRMPLVWRSKYPIIYVLAGVSSLSGLEPWQAFATLSAVLLALAAVGFLLFAYHGLGAGRFAALLAMALAALDRVVLHLVVHPYYNQLWGLVMLPFILLFGFRFLRNPTRRDAALLGGFSAVGTFAYPLMMFFPVVALGACAWMVWRRRRAQGKGPGWIAALDLPRGRRALLVWVPLGALAAPFLAIVLFGVIEKVRGLAKVMLPGQDLAEWTGDIVTYPFGYFFGLSAGPAVLIAVAVAGLFAAAAFALRRCDRELRVPLYATGVAALLFALYFGLRENGRYLYFKDVAFLGPLVVAIAVTWLVRQATSSPRGRLARWSAAGAIVLMFAVFARNIGDEISENFEQLPSATIELEQWARALPRDASVRIDLDPGGSQLWALYFLHERRVSASRPLLDAGYPSPPRSRRADFVLVAGDRRRPSDAVGTPVRQNDKLALYRLRRDLPGRDHSSYELVQPKFKAGLD